MPSSLTIRNPEKGCSLRECISKIHALWHEGHQLGATIIVRSQDLDPAEEAVCATDLIRAVQYVKQYMAEGDNVTRVTIRARITPGNNQKFVVANIDRIANDNWRISWSRNRKRKLSV